MKRYALCRPSERKGAKKGEIETIMIHCVFDPFLVGPMLVKGCRLVIRVDDSKMDMIAPSKQERVKRI